MDYYEPPAEGLFLFDDEIDREAAFEDHVFIDRGPSVTPGSKSGGGDFLQSSGFPPAMKDWKESPFDVEPSLTVDRSRGDLWNQGTVEINHVLKKIKELPDVSDEDKSTLGKVEGIEKLDGILKIFDLLFGEDSELFWAFKKILPPSTPNRLGHFPSFLATFFYTCINNRNYRKQHQYHRSNTNNLLDPDEFDDILTKMDDYNKGKEGKPRFWTLLESAFNRSMGGTFMLAKDDGHVTLGVDDDKVAFNYGKQKADDDSGLKRARHVRDNLKGFVNHVVTFAASGLPIYSAFERKGQTDFDCVTNMLRELFGAEKKEELPDLTNFAELDVDRGYLKLPLLVWFLMTGGDVLATVPRNEWFAFTFGKEASEGSSNKDKDKPQFIPVKGPKCVYQ